MGTEIRYDFSHLKVLLVEDMKYNYIFMQNIFDFLQITEYDIAKNGIEAIGYSYENEYDLIIMDVEMPYMDGNTATKILKKNLEIKTPICVWTTLDSDEEKLVSEIGYDKFIHKPFDFAELVDMFKNVSLRKCVA